MASMTASSTRPPDALPSRYWADLTTVDFARLKAAGGVDDVVAVLPLGATEQHGPHLPLSVDTALVDGIVRAALAHVPPELRVLVLPTQTIGQSVEHADFPGTLTLSTATVIQMWMEIGACVARAGVRKLFIFNAHGGHSGLMDVVARDLRAQHGLTVFACSWFNLPQAPEVASLFDAHERRFGVHAGAIETALMLALDPGKVRMDLAQRFVSSTEQRAQQCAILGNGYSAKLGWMMRDLNAQGAAGHAAAATPAQGDALLREAGLQLAAALQEFTRLPIAR